MAKNRNNNQGGRIRYDKDDVANAIFSNAGGMGAIGINIDKVFRELSKKHVALSKEAKADLQKMVDAYTKGEEESIKKMSIVEKKRHADKIIALIEENKHLYANEKTASSFEKKRKDAIAERKKLTEEETKYLEKWSKKLDSITSSGYKSNRQLSIERRKEKISDYTKRFNTAVEDGDEKTARLMLMHIEKQTKALNREEKGREELNKAVNQIGSNLKKWGNSIQSSLDNLYNEQVRFNARTTSADDAYGNMVKDISSLIGTSPFIKQSDVINNLSAIADSGSNYNIEQRAYLATLAKDISSTFDITGGELLRLNRLLHTDMSSVMLGMEQNLTSALNSTFNDSSFMNSLRDAVASGVMDAQAQLSAGQGTDFAWAVQTWMGALSSAGVEDSVISMLTQGLNYLGSGNVSAMSGNDQLQTLFALAAANSGGKSYSEMLVNGIDASDVNTLMKEMISYLQEIAGENKVVQSEYFRILGMGGLSNMTALSNVDVSEVYSMAQNSNTNINTGYYSSSSMLNRVNVIKENLMTSMAEEIGSSSGMLGTWILANLLDEVAGGISIPSILGLGTGVIMDTTVADTMRSLAMASAAFGTIPKIWASIQNGGIADFGAFQEQAGGITTGFGTSVSYAVGNSSSSDVMQNSIASQAKTAQKNKKTVSNAIGENEEDSAEKQLKSIRDNTISIKDSATSLNEKTVLIADKFNAMFTKFDDETNPIRVQVKDFNKLTDAITQDKVQKVEGTVTLAGFNSSSEKTLNDVLTNAIALAIKMIVGGATGPNANEMMMEGGYVDGGYMESMTLMEFLTKIIESNTQTQEQISNTFDYFTQQKDSSYIR